jgi:hypothetical protein
MPTRCHTMTQEIGSFEAFSTRWNMDQVILSTASYLCLSLFIYIGILLADLWEAMPDSSS